MAENKKYTLQLKELFVKHIFTWIILSILLILSYFWLFRVSIFERHLSNELNLTVKVSNVTFGFGKIIVDDVTIKNPRQTAITNVLEIQKLEIDIDPLQFFKSKKKVDRIQIFKPTIFIEFYNFNGSESNWSNILNGFTFENRKRYIINTLSLLEIYFQAYDFDGSEIPIWPIPYLEIRDLNVPNGLTLTEVTKIVMLNVFSKAISDTPLESFVNGIKPLLPEFAQPKRSPYRYD